jgi:hypothetical protein
MGEPPVAGEGSGSGCGSARDRRAATRVNSGRAERLPSGWPPAGTGAGGLRQAQGRGPTSAGASSGGLGKL